MSTHDYDLANQAGAAFRADLNNALLAIVSQNSAATEPATMFAYQFWADTTTGILKQRNAANTAWVNILTLSTGKVALAVAADTATTSITATNTGGKTTIASAATPDIFATSVGTIVDYTGTATCTGFVAAPQAGATKRLICAGACLFTAGANLLIEGITSGTTITLAANAIVDVTAITTTQFKMTYSVSGTFTATGTGFTANPTGTAAYVVENGCATIRIPNLSGTSNITEFTITGLPASLTPANANYSGYTPGQNNTTNTYVASLLTTSGGLNITLLNALLGASGWTGSGTKSLNACTLRFVVG